MDMKPIIAEFVVDIYEDTDAAGHPYSQAGDIDDGVGLLSFEIPEGNLQVVVEHDYTPVK